jgi:SH3-like domain-containing protein
MMRISLFASLSLLAWSLSLPAAAIEFRSVSADKVILYDAPSVQAEKLYILTSSYPVEVIVNLGEWIKVRDQYGSLSWIQGKLLAPTRTVLVKTDDVPIKQKAAEDAPVLANLKKDVVLELLSTTPQNGWVQVKHKDGITGYVLISSLWGI